MKKKLYAILMVMVLLLAAVGCSPEEPAVQQNLYNGKTYDAYLTEMMEANRTLELLKTRDEISIAMEVTDGEGAAVAQIHTHYTRSADGQLLFAHKETYEGTGEPIVINGYAGPNDTGAYYMVSGDFKSMMVYPADEYESSIANDSALDMTLMGYMEYPEAIAEENGNLVITTILSNLDTGENSRVIYTADPQTLELKERAIFTYNEDGDLTSQSHTVYTYEGGTEAEYAAAEAILEAEDSCQLTVILVSGGEKTEEQRFTVAKDTKVVFQSFEKTFKMYGDEEQKEKLRSIDVTGEEATVYIVFDKEK